MSKRYGKIFSEIDLYPGDQGVMSFNSVDGPYFKPHRIRWSVMDDSGHTHDLRVGSVTVGGSPQLAITSLVKGESKPSVSHRDLSDASTWSLASGSGLARELQISVWNSNLFHGVSVKACVEGEYFDDIKDAPTAPDGPSLLGSCEVELAPKSRQLIKAIPYVSSYFKVQRIRYHAFGSYGGSVPLGVLGTFVGNKMVMGRLSVAELVAGSADSTPSIPSTLLHGDDGWECGKHIGIVSTISLGRELCLVVENTFDDVVRASVTCEGMPMSEFNPRPAGGCGGNITLTSGSNFRV